MEEIRLNKYLSEMGICSRREADRLIEAGKVLVDGQTAPMGMKITPDQKVVCDGKTVGMVENGRRKKPKPVLLMVNKPRGIVSTTSDKDRAMNIVELVKYPERVYPVGRLDKDSEGLILLTNQGDLVNKIMKASNGHEKEYVVTVDKPVTAKFIEKMSAGVYLDELDVTTRECEVRATGNCPDPGLKSSDPPDVRNAGLPCPDSETCPDHEPAAWQFKNRNVSEGKQRGV